MNQNPPASLRKESRFPFLYPFDEQSRFLCDATEDFTRGLHSNARTERTGK